MSALYSQTNLKTRQTWRSVLRPAALLCLGTRQRTRVFRLAGRKIYAPNPVSVFKGLTIALNKRLRGACGMFRPARRHNGYIAGAARC